MKHLFLSISIILLALVSQGQPDFKAVYYKELIFNEKTLSYDTLPKEETNAKILFREGRLTLKGLDPEYDGDYQSWNTLSRDDSRREASYMVRDIMDNRNSLVKMKWYYLDGRVVMEFLFQPMTWEANTRIYICTKKTG